MKYMLMMFGSEQEMLATQSRDWIVDMINFMNRFNDQLVADGEFVTAEGLVDASQAKTVRFDDSGVVVTDGPFAEAKESVPGFWIVDVDSEARAVELASTVVAFTHGPIEVRQVGEAPEV